MSSIQILVVFCICGTVLGDSEDCSQDAVLRCKDQLETYFTPGGLQKIGNNFEKFCNVLQGTTNCVKNKLENCVSDEALKASILEAIQLDRIEEMQQTMCSPEFRSKLSRGKCHTSGQNDILQCKTNMEWAMQDNENVIDIAELGVKTCCVVDEYVQCAMAATRRQCTVDVVDTTGALLGVMQNNPKCKNYKHGTGACEKYTSEGNMNRAWIWLLLPVLVVKIL